MKYFTYESAENDGQPMVSLDLTAPEMLTISTALAMSVYDHIEWLADKDNTENFMVDKLRVFTEKAELTGAIKAIFDSMWEEHLMWEDHSMVCDACIEEMIEKETNKENDK